MHALPLGSLASAGQVGLVPVQVSSTSHAPAAARHTVPAFPAGWVHDPPLHKSLVHGLVSSAQAVPSARWLARHVPAPSQLSGWSQSELLPLPQAVPAGWKPLSWQGPRAFQGFLLGAPLAASPPEGAPGAGVGWEGVGGAGRTRPLTQRVRVPPARRKTAYGARRGQLIRRAVVTRPVAGLGD